MPKTKIVFKKRTFLNDNPSMSAFIVAVLEEFNIERGETRISCYPTFDIADCSNKVSLDFSFYSTRQMNESLKKLRLLKEVVDGFAKAFEKEVKKHNKRDKSPKIKSEKTKKKVKIIETTTV